MNIHLVDEVISAAFFSSGEKDSLVSRRSIEYQITDNPGLYPLLFSETQANRRNIISRVMNARFSSWSRSRGRHKSSFVWKIRNQDGEES